VWLSEGFATYFTSLFIEHAYGRDEFAQVLRDSRKTIVDFYAQRPEYRVVHENLADMSQVTTGMTYQKGAWVLHMLRQRIGDDRFWAGIRDYYARHMNGTATTTDFRLAMERATGQDLRAFFDQWLYRGGIPRLDITWRWDAAAREVVVEWSQRERLSTFRWSLGCVTAMPSACIRWRSPAQEARLESRRTQRPQGWWWILGCGPWSMQRFSAGSGRGRAAGCARAGLCREAIGAQGGRRIPDDKCCQGLADSNDRLIPSCQSVLQPQ
jgi:Peptidase family M1 domain